MDWIIGLVVLLGLGYFGYRYYLKQPAIDPVTPSPEKEDNNKGV